MRSKLLLPTFCEKDTPAGKAPQCHLFDNKSSRRDQLINIYEPAKVYKKNCLIFYYVDVLTKWWPFIRNVLSLRKFLMHSSRMNCSLHQRSTFEQIPVHHQHHDHHNHSYHHHHHHYSQDYQHHRCHHNLDQGKWNDGRILQLHFRKKKIGLVWLIEPSSKCVLFWFFSIK